jgi:thiol-disulfide isomerase/thioredoxin
MKFIVSFGVALMSLSNISGCVSSDKGGKESQIMKSEERLKVDPSQAPWFQGTVEAAYGEAKKTNKPILLYWGAVWCPPCHEIKEQVFSRPQFLNIVQPVIPVYLDGDTERAQLWGDKLEIGGYPTILMIGPDGKELARINGGVNIDEFAQMVESTIAQGGGIDAAITRAKSGKATSADWKLLAYFSWGQVPESRELKPKDQIELLKKLADECPANLPQEKALLSATFLEAASSASASSDKTAKAAADLHAKDAGKYLAAIIDNYPTTKSARGTLMYSSASIIDWGWPKGHKDRKMIQERVIAASQKLTRDTSLSVDTRLWANYPIMEIENSNRPTKTDKDPKEPDYAPPTRTIIKNAALEADRRAISKSQRHAVVSGAAYLLREIKEYDLARDMLRRELAMTDTPYYYQSSFASLEQAAGNDQEALKWSEKARKSADGRATKLQWLVSDMQLTAKIKSPDQEKRLNMLASDFYSSVFKLPDGFAGRNKYRAERVAKTLKDFMKKQSFKKLVLSYNDRCASVDEKARENCKKHFESLLK